ncbi:unnamed protein product [Victoria cruziana]
MGCCSGVSVCELLGQLSRFAILWGRRALDGCDRSETREGKHRCDKASALLYRKRRKNSSPTLDDRQRCL